MLFPKNVYASVPCTLQCASHVCIRDSLCVCVCVCVCDIIGVNMCALLVHVNVRPSVSRYV